MNHLGPGRDGHLAPPAAHEHSSHDAEDRGMMGYCGNVMKVTVRAGKYAILGPGWIMQETEPSVDPTAGPGGFVPPRSLAVLEVLP